MELALLAEASVMLSISPTAWRNAPLEMFAHTVEQARQLCQSLGVPFAMDDHGHRGGKDRLIIQFAGCGSLTGKLSEVCQSMRAVRRFCTDLNRPIVVFVDNGVVGKTGAATATAVLHHAKEMQIADKLGGQMTDSASPVILAQAAELKRKLERWIAAPGCTVHVYVRPSSEG